MKKRAWKEAAAFLATAFGITWLLWFGAYANLVPAPAQLIRLGTAVPSLAGLLFTARFDGRPALFALLGAAVRFQAPRAGWLYATLLFPATLLLACTGLAAVGGRLPPAQFPPRVLPLAFFYILVCMGPLGEELGWRGFLLRRLLPGLGLVKAGLLLGLIWSAWHLPLFLIPGTIQHTLAEMGLFIAVAGYFLYTTCISLLIGVLYVRTDGNLLLCLVFHTVCNLSLGVAPIVLEKTGASILLVALFLAVGFVLKAAAKNPLASREQGAHPDET